jgi:hypothetical protein
MKSFNKGIVALAVFIAVISPALAAGAQDFESVAYWETQFGHDAVCHPSSDTGHGFISDDGLSVVLFEFDLTWTYGDHWEGLVVFGGDTHIQTEHPQVGVEYPAPGGAEVSNWIVCKGVAPETTTTTTTTTAAPEDTTTTTAAPEDTTTTTAAPGETTTTTAAPTTSAAPAGAVASGAGGTADSDQSALLVLGGVAAIAAVAGAGYAGRRRSES